MKPKTLKMIKDLGDNLFIIFENGQCKIYRNDDEISIFTGTYKQCEIKAEEIRRENLVNRF